MVVGVELHRGRGDVWGGENYARLGVGHELLAMRGHVGERIVGHHSPHR